MNRKWWKLIYMLPITFCTLYAGGYVAQFIRNYQTWESAGNFAGNGTAPQIPSPHPLACLDALTAFPYNLYGIFLCLAAFGLLTFLLMRMGFDRNGEITDRGRNLNYSTKGTYGTSGFMTLEEMHQVLELTNDVKKHKGTILGKLNGKAVCLPKDTRMNRNIAVYGASGSMKSRAFARNMIFQCVARGESLIITDPKSELYESTATYLENAGYIVKSFNLVNPENSDSCHHPEYRFCQRRSLLGQCRDELIKSSDSLCGSGIPTGGKEYRTGIQTPDHEFGKRTEQPL